MPLTDQGLPTEERYQFVPRVLVFLNRGEHVLLLKGSPSKKVWPNLYNGLGGHVERGESVMQAAMREVQEESGLRPNKLWLCAVVTIDIHEKSGIVMWVLRGEAPDGEFIDSSEGSLEWIHQDQLGDYELVEDIPVLLPLVLGIGAGDAPLWGRYRYDQKGNLEMDFD